MNEKLQNAGLLVLRVVFGTTLALHHGLPKLLTFAEKAGRFPDPLHVGHTASLCLAIFGELVCGLAVALGLLTRAAAVPALITMLVALTAIHGGSLEEGELALTYLVGFVAIALAGPGDWSLDALIAKKRDGWLP